MTKIKLLTKALLVAAISLFVSCGNNNQQADAYGNFEAVEVVVSAMANGQILSFDLNEGDQLTAGKIVGLIDTTELFLRSQQLLNQRQAVLSRLKTVNAQMKVQQQQLKNIGADKQRIIALFNDGAATSKQKEDIEGAYLLTEKQVEATQSQTESIVAEAETILSQISQVDEQIRKCQIINPIDGIVLTKFVESTEVVTFGKSLYKIADLSQLELRGYISGLQMSDFKIGEEVEVSIDASKTENKTMRGTVSWIASSAEFTPKTIQTKEERVDLVYAIKVVVKNDGSLKIGMPGEISKIN